MIELKKKHNKSLIIIFACILVSTLIFALYKSFNTSLDVSLHTSFNNKVQDDEIIIKSITPVYDENSTIVVENNNVVFNDKNQVVKYNIVLENTQNYDVKVIDINLSTPTESFLKYEIDKVIEGDVVKANSTKELTISLETMGIKGWGRNFADELTANISFEKTEKVEENQPEAPAPNTEELVAKEEKIEVNSVTQGTIELKNDTKVEVGQKIAIWIYSEPIFLGYFDIVEKDGIKQIVGIEEALKKVDIEPGEHNIALVSEKQETIGYIGVYINENKELLKENIDNSPESNPSEESTPSKPNDDSNNKEEIENPYTSTHTFIIDFIVIICGTGIYLFVIKKKKVGRYIVPVIVLFSIFTYVDAQDIIESTIKLNVSFKSQNVMKKALILDENDEKVYYDYWQYRTQIKNFYIQNEINEIEEYVHKFDVTEEKNGRVVAYLVTNKQNSDYYDVYLQADGIIYPNTNASYYFDAMKNLDKIDNLAGLDTSEVTNMKCMFQDVGKSSTSFTLDVSSLNTSNVTNMSYMFNRLGINSKTLTLDVSNFNTSNVTNMSFMFNGTGGSSYVFNLDVSKFDTSKVKDMRFMFYQTGYSNTKFTLDISNFDTSNVTDMSNMFYETGYSSKALELDVSNFNTSNVTNMAGMFIYAGYSNPNFTLNLSNFNTSKVTDMSRMFYYTGYNSQKLTLDLSNFDTSNVTDMSRMFYYTGYKNPNFTLDISNFNTSNVLDMSYMFNETGNASTVLDIDVSNFDTSKVTNTSFMFYKTGYSNPNFTLNVSNFNTKNVTDMSNMFYETGYNSKVLELNVSNFNTSKVTNMDGMFIYAGYSNPNFTLDVSNFNTSNVTNMSRMFYYTGYNSKSLNLDVSKFDTRKVTKMKRMFNYAGYNSSKMNSSITIKNTSTPEYDHIFESFAVKKGAKFIVNYTGQTKRLVEKMGATKTSGSGVEKGELIS